MSSKEPVRAQKLTPRSRAQPTKREKRAWASANSQAVKPVVEPERDAIIEPLNFGGGDDTRSEMRAAIVDAAVDFFYEKGFAATGVQDIVARANCTKGGLYYYFSSKEDLLIEIHNVFMEYALVSARRIERADHAPTMAMRLIIRDLMRLVENYRPHMTILFQESRLIDFERYPDALAARQEWENIIVDMIDRGLNSGEFRPDIAPAKVASWSILGMCFWASYRWYKEDSGLDADAVSEVFANIVLGGIATGSLRRT
jgi:AcrR family transcriptional regulator